MLSVIIIIVKTSIIADPGSKAHQNITMNRNIKQGQKSGITEDFGCKCHFGKIGLEIFTEQRLSDDCID